MDHDTAGLSPVGAGSTALFEQLFKAHFKDLHGYACSIVKDDATAEEMVQNVFYKLWEKKDRVNIEQSVSGYLYRAVYNECMNYLKHNKVKRNYQVHVNSTSSEAFDGEEQVELRELQQKIQTALSELPEQCRTIFHLSRNEELKYSNIADKLGISMKTVEYQMGKALKLLRSKLADFLPVLGLLFINVKNFME